MLPQFYVYSGGERKKKVQKIVQTNKSKISLDFSAQNQIQVNRLISGEYIDNSENKFLVKNLEKIRFLNAFMVIFTRYVLKKSSDHKKVIRNILDENGDKRIDRYIKYFKKIKCLDSSGEIDTKKIYNQVKVYTQIVEKMMS